MLSLNSFKKVELQKMYKIFYNTSGSNFKKKELIDFITKKLVSDKSIKGSRKYTGTTVFTECPAFFTFEKKLNDIPECNYKLYDVILEDGYLANLDNFHTTKKEEFIALNKTHTELVEAKVCPEYITFFNIKKDSNVFVVNTQKKVLFLELLKNNIKKLFDGIIITKDITGYDDIFYFYNKSIISDYKENVDITALNNEIEIYQSYYNSYYKRDKLKEYHVMYNMIKIDLSKTGIAYNKEKDVYELVDSSYIEPIRVTENRLLREYGKVDNNFNIVDGDTTVNSMFICKTSDYMNNLVKQLMKDMNLSFSQIKIAQEIANRRIHHILEKGLMVNINNNCTLFKPFLQSSAQSRTGKAFWSCFKEPDTVRNELVYGSMAKLTKKGIAKTNKYLALSTSGSKVINGKFTFKCIPDVYNHIKSDKYGYKGKDKIYIERGAELETNPCDGGGTILPIPCFNISHELGLISTYELVYLLNHFTTIDKLKNSSNKKLLKIFNKIPRAFQIRHAGDKGLLLMYDHTKYDYTQDIVVTDSMRKFTSQTKKDEDIPLEVCAYEKLSLKDSCLNYQFINACKFNKNDIIDLANEFLVNLDGSEEAILNNPMKVIKFLGLISSSDDIISDDKENNEDKAYLKFVEAIKVCPEMIKDEYVRNKIKGLLEKKLNEMSFGKIPIKGARFVYLFSDPRFMFGNKNCIKNNTIYFNGTDDEYAMFRSPLIDKGEAVIRKACYEEEFWYLHNIIIVSPYDDILPRMGGADL